MKTYKMPITKVVLLFDTDICQTMGVGSLTTDEECTKRQDNPGNGSIWNTWTSDDDK